MIETEQHPLQPFLPSNTRLLMLGSFPPQKKRWSMDFYYPNLQNDMWRIFGTVFFEDKNHFLVSNKKAFDRDLLIEFLEKKGIALYDTASSVRRLQDNASDKFLEIVEPTNIDLLLRHIPQCRAIVTTGQKATDTLREQIDVEEPKVGYFATFLHHEKEMRLYRMPSSSRAYPKPLDEKAEVYRKMFEEMNLL